MDGGVPSTSPRNRAATPSGRPQRSGARQIFEIVRGSAQAAFLAALARSFLHLARNTLRSLPCRFLASACFEHSIESAVRGLAGAFGVVCATATPKVKASAMALVSSVAALIGRSIGYPAPPSCSPRTGPATPLYAELACLVNLR